MTAPFPPHEPPAPDVAFPPAESADEYGLVALGDDYRPSTILLAYRSGIFPWPHANRLPWFSPDPRAIFPLDAPPPWSRSLRRTLRKHPYSVSLDSAFSDVMRACRDARQGRTWINDSMIGAYTELHERGFAHSVEVWEGQELVGGIYGVAIGSAFGGESMFHRKTDCSKIAFAALVASLQASGFDLFDVQLQNPHLESLGAIEISRARFLEMQRASVARGPCELKLALPR